MQNAGAYLVILVIGALIGASLVGYVTTINQKQAAAEQVKVTIQGISYRALDSVLEIELLNDAPEKNLEGKLVICQDENQWSSDVKWYYTGSGETEILCSLIDENESFRIMYNENNPELTYLDIMVEWYEVDQGAISVTETNTS
jgi:hypothetical protein